MNDHALTGGAPASSAPDAGADFRPGDSSPQACDDFASDPVGALPAGWVAAGGDWTIAVIDGHHALKQAGSVSQLVSASAPSAANDVEVQATLLPGSTAESCVLARYQSDRNHYELCVSGGNAWSLAKVHDGTRTTLDSGKHGYDTSSAHQLSLTVQGTHLMARLDDTRLSWQTDGALTQGGIGVATAGENGFSPVCVVAM